MSAIIGGRGVAKNELCKLPIDAAGDLWERQEPFVLRWTRVNGDDWDGDESRNKSDKKKPK